MAHYQSLPLPFKLQPVCLSTALISGRDIKMMSRHLFVQCSLSVDVATSVSCRDIIVFITFNFMSRPHSYVATSFACEDLSCGCIDKSLSRPRSYVTTSFISFWCRDIEMMSRHEFLHWIVPLSLDHVFFVATSFFTSRLHLFTFQFLLQS